MGQPVVLHRLERLRHGDTEVRDDAWPAVHKDIGHQQDQTCIPDFTDIAASLFASTNVQQICKHTAAVVKWVAQHAYLEMANLDAAMTPCAQCMQQVSEVQEV